MDPFAHASEGIRNLGISVGVAVKKIPKAEKPIKLVLNSLEQS
jgi:hypothetical protein